MAGSNEQDRPQGLVRKAERVLVSVALGLVLYPVRAAWLLVELGLRFSLLLLAAVLVGYFLLTTNVTGERLLGLANDALMGHFEAEHVSWSLFSDRVELFGVLIRHPAGRDLVRAGHVDVRVDRDAVLKWALKRAVGVEAALPVHFRDVQVSDFRVEMPFTERGFEFGEAFEPRVRRPPVEKPGPPPKVWFDRIALEDGRVLMEFPDWAMDIAVRKIETSLEVADGLPRMESRGIDVPSFEMTGELLPGPLRFLGEPSAVRVDRFRLSGTELVVDGCHVERPDLRVTATLAFDVGQENVPATGTAEVEVLGPGRLDELSFGHVFGEVTAKVTLTGMLARPELAGTFASDRLEVEGLPLEKVSFAAAVSFEDGVSVSARGLSASLWGSEVSVPQTSFRAGGDGSTWVGFDACFEPLSPALVAAPFLVDLPDLLDGLIVAGCCTGCEVAAGPDGPTLRGRVDLVADPGGPLAKLGAAPTAVDGAVEVTPAYLGWNRLQAKTAAVSLETSGRLDLGGSELRMDLTAEVDALDLAAIPALAALGTTGLVQKAALVVKGTPAHPTVAATLLAADAVVQGRRFESLDAGGAWNDGQVALDRFCFQSGANRGCLSGTADLRGMLAGEKPLSVPVTLAIDEPVTVDLSDLPYASLPVSGLVEVGPAAVSARVGKNLERTLSSAAVSVTARSAGLELPGGATLDGVRVKVRREQGQEGEAALAGLRVLAAFDLGTSGDLTVEDGSAEVAIEVYSGWPDNSLLPLIVGDARVEAGRISTPQVKLVSASVDVRGSDGPPAVKLRGTAALTRDVGVELSGTLDPLSGRADLKAWFSRFTLAAMPPVKLGAGVREMLRRTVVSGRLEVAGIDVPAALEGDWKGLLAGLSGGGKLTVTGLEALPEPVSRLEVEAKFRKQEFSFSRLEVQLRNGAVLRGQGTFRPKGQVASGWVEATPVRLSTLQVLAGKALPVDATVSGRVDVDGPIAHLKVKGQLAVKEMTTAVLPLGDAVLEVEGTVGDKVVLRSPEFFPGFTLKEGEVRFSDAGPPAVHLGLDFDQFALARVLPSLPPEVTVTASGSAVMDIRPADEAQPFLLHLDMPREQVEACLKLPIGPLCMANGSAAHVEVSASGVSFPQRVQLAGGGHSVAAQGRIDFAAGWDLSAFADVDLARFAFLADYFALFGGQLGLGAEGVRLTGPLADPHVDGAVRLTGVHLVPRHLGSEILLKQGRVLVSGGLATGTVTAWIPDTDPFVVLIDEGSVQAFGEVQLVGWKPETCDLRVNGRDVYYQAPGQFKVLLNPEVRLVMHDLSSGDQAGGRLSGDVLVAEGEFTRDFDRLIGSFASAFSRQQEAYSRPLTEILPVLKNIELDLHVEGGNFAVSSKFPFGETELTVDLDLRVTGTLDDLKLWDRMRIMPGGTITYKVVRRVFDVTQGSVDFTGDPAHPYLDVTAQTDVSYKPTVLPGEQPPAGFTSQELSWGKTVTIVIHLTGVYPNLTPEFSSPNAAEFDTADLQTLLLLGMTRKDLEGRSGGTQSDISINLFTDDVAGAVSKLLLAPFVDAVSLGFTQQGGFQAEAATKIGRALSVTTRVTQNATTSDYSAGFQFKITDRLSLEGRMKLYQEPDKPQQQTYEGKFRYLIPLE